MFAPFLHCDSHLQVFAMAPFSLPFGTVLICALSLLTEPKHFHIIDVVLHCLCQLFSQLWRIMQARFPSCYCAPCLFFLISFQNCHRSSSNNGNAHVLYLGVAAKNCRLVVDSFILCDRLSELYICTSILRSQCFAAQPYCTSLIVFIGQRSAEVEAVTFEGSLLKGSFQA